MTKSDQLKSLIEAVVSQRMTEEYVVFNRRSTDAEIALVDFVVANPAALTETEKRDGWADGIEAAARLCEADGHRRWLLAEEATNDGDHAKADWQTAGHIAAGKLAIAIRALIAAVPSASAEGNGWRPIERAPKDGTAIIGGYFHQPWAENHREGRIVKVWFQPEFDSFISGCRQMTLAPGYTFDGGATSELHSPDKEDVSHWMPLPSPPAVPATAAKEE